MTIKVSQENWKDEEYRNVILGVAEILGEDVTIVMPKEEKQLYNVQIWKDDDILLEKDFDKKSQAKKWITKVLKMKKCENAYADLKKYNKSNDDFDWWFYRIINDKLTEVFDI